MAESLGVERLSAKRYWTNRITAWIVGLGGAGVIGAITLIFAYLLWVVAPIFFPGSITPLQQLSVSERAPALVDVSENGDVYLRLSKDGILEFYGAADGQAISAYNLGINIVKAQRVYPTVDLYALLDDQARLIFIRTQFIVNFVDGNRTLTPKLSFPFGKRPQSFAANPASIDLFDVHLNDSELMVAISENTTLTLQYFRNAEMGLNLRGVQEVSLQLLQVPHKILIGPRNEWVYVVAANGDIEVLDTKPLNKISRIYQGNLIAPGNELTAVDAVWVDILYWLQTAAQH